MKHVVALLSLLAMLLAAPSMRANVLDPAFGIGGAVSVDLGGSYDQGQAVALDSLGRIVVLGRHEYPNGTQDTDFIVTRFHPDGTLDTSFGNQGTAIVWFDIEPYGQDWPQDLAIDAQDRILVAGRAGRAAGASPAETKVALARLLPSGQLDGSFGSGGKVLSVIAPHYGLPEALGIAVDGSAILVGGDATVGHNDSDLFVARFDASGALDPSYGTGGYRQIWFDLGTPAYDNLEELLRTPSGDVYLVASAYNGQTWEVGVAALDGSGDPLWHYGQNGKTVLSDIDGDPWYFGFFRADLDALDRIIVGGASDPGSAGVYQAAVVRLEIDGTPDPSFGQGGFAHHSFHAGSNTWANPRVLPSGKIMLVGGVHRPASSHLFEMAFTRLHADGSVDATFAANGPSPGTHIQPHTAGQTAVSAAVEAAVAQFDGRLVATGFHAPPGNPMGQDLLVVRLEP